jgi:hypothetical protein
MARIKKITLAALVAFALAAGGLAVGGGVGQVAGSNPTSFGRESASLLATPEEAQIASSAGTRAKIGRESA